ncbi:MAG: IPT/TIG domain-containing protein [Dehalococcoidia bacterium]|nr:IPT/TIG domain-containing protein [Dehalococcoidia bacterium]
MERIKVLRTLAVAVTLSIVGVIVMAAPALAAPEITLTPASGALGTEVAVSGQNFESYRGDNISIYFDGREVDTLVVPDSGSFTSTFAVPDEAAAGRVYVTVRDELDNQLGTRRPFIVDEMEVDLRPADGMVGTDVTILGKGFYAGEEVTVYYSG